MRRTNPCAGKGLTMTWGLQEADVVRNYDGVELQGHMVPVRKGKRNSLNAPTIRTHEARMQIAVGLHHWAEKERRGCLYFQ